MASIIVFNKPYMVLSQFTDSDNRSTLADFLNQEQTKGYYAAGRLDRDSEGLMVLTNNGSLQSRIAHPKNKLAKTYWAQVEGEITADALAALRDGVELNDGPTLPAKAKAMIQPTTLWPRNPPIRERANKPTSWLKLTITEGRNRQVRRMTAAVGFPTLRLVRAQVGPWKLEQLQPGEYRWEDCHLPETTRPKTASFRRKRSK